MTSRNSIKYGITLVGILSLVVVGGLALSGLQDEIKLANNTSQDSAKLVNNEEPLSGNADSSLIELSHEELSKNSDTIVIGTVKEILPSKWNSIDGKKPSENVTFSPHNVIYTDITINVDKYIKNPLSSKEVRVRVEGGTVGNDTLKSDSEPSFEIGENVLLYLMKDDNPGTKDISPDHFIVTGCLQGKYRLTDDGKAIRPDETVSQDELINKNKK